MSSHDYPVDLVYLWCDSADPAFRAKRAKYAARFGVAIDDDNNGDARYRSNDELKYSLRSAELDVPWIRKVFICIDDDQTPPSWLNLENPKLRIVRHGEFIPQEFLPTFNSLAIEHFLWRIPDLSEHFLFANDDMMFGRPLEKDFFFAEDAKPYCRFRSPMPPINENSDTYRRSLENSAGLVRSRHTELNDDVKTAMSRWPHHNVDAYIKSDLAKVHEIFRETIIETTLRNPFRAKDNIIRFIFSYCGIQSFGWHYRQVENIDHDSVEAHTYWQLAVQLNSDSRPGLFCFNDNERQADYERRHGMRLISGLLLPEPSSFEKAETAPKPATKAERDTIRKELERYCEVNDRDNYSLFARMALVRLRKEPILPSDNARISIIIPVHDAEKDINDCLASVFSVKEASDIEVICVDDGSADDSVELIQEWTGVAPNLRVVSNDGHGVEAARKTGLSVAKGTKIVFLDPAARLMQDSALLHVQGESNIKPAFAENNIPIVATTDENYLEYTKVLLRSIIATTSCNIDFLIFHEGIAEEKRREFAECFSRQENLSVRFVDMAEHVKSSKDAGFADKRYPVSTCFRVYAPYVLTEYEKAVYLDIDTIVCRDISELYNADLGDSLMGCVVDVVNSSSKAAYASFARMHGFVEWDKYFNAGVLLMNFKAFRYCGMLDSLLKIIIEASKREFFPDQDALNFVCKGRVKYLDPRWHVQLGDYCLKEQLALTGDEIWIAHFTAGQKPWNFPLRCFSNLWWRYVCCEEGLNLWRKASGDNPQVAIGDGIAASVVIPIYNAESYLAQTLISYCVQTLRNIEIICIDDGSTDGSRAICEKFASLDSRIRILSQKNLGAAVARNRGIEESRGRWLFFGDADDFCRHDMLEELVRAGQNDCHDVVVAGRMIMDCGHSMQVREVGVPRGYFGKGRNVNCHTDGINVFAGLGFAPWNKLFRRAFVIEKGIKFHNNPSCDDVFFVFSSLIAAESIAFVDKTYYYYRANLPTSQMGLADKNPTNFLVALREVKSLLDGESLRLKEQFYCAAVHSCFDHLFARKTSEGRRITFAALQNGGLESLCFPQIDSRTFDLGSIRRVFDLTVSGGSLADVIAEQYQANCAKTADLTARLETAQSSVAKLNARMEELNMAAKRRNEWLAAEKKKVAKRDERISALKAELDEKLKAIMNRDAWLATEKEKVAKRDERISALKAELDEKLKAILNRDAWLASEKEKVAKRDERISALKTHTEQKQQSVIRYREWLAAEKDKVSKRDERIINLKNKLDLNTQTLSEREKRIAKLFEQISHEQRLVLERDKQLNEVKNTLADYKAKVSLANSEIVKQEAKISELKGKLDSISRIVE